MKRPSLKTLFTLPKKFYWREILAVLLLIIGIYFFRKERRELGAILPYLHQSHKGWLLMAALVTGIFVLMQSAMYVFSFAAIKEKLSLGKSIEMFLKRNFLSTFLPGGGVSALAYIPRSVKRTVPDKLKINQASGLFGLAGVVSTFCISLIVVLLSAGGGQRTGQMVIGLVVLSILVSLLFYLVYAIKKEQKLFVWLKNKYPKLADNLYKMAGAHVRGKLYLLVLLASLGVELCGIAHLYISMLAVGAQPSLQAAGLAYVISVLLMVASPFLRGVGAVELSTVVILTSFGYGNAEALAIALIYRTFEFWLPMLCGLIAFLLKGKQLFLRLFPAFTIFLLGVVTILSVLTPPLAQRMQVLRQFIPSGAIYTSTVLMIYIGVALIAVAALLIRGLKNAWWLAVIFTSLSLIGHLLKGLDWEEATLAFAVLITLLLTAKQYTARSNPRLINLALRAAVLTFIAVLVYCFTGFYFLEKRNFGIDFSWSQSLSYALRSFFLQNNELRPLTNFGREFIISTYILASAAWLFLLYAIIRPFVSLSVFNQEREKAEALLKKYGHSAVDHFKIAPDKLFYFSKERKGFVAYRIEKGFAIVLEMPVCAEEDTNTMLNEFAAYCKKAGVKTAYYRVDEKDLVRFAVSKKKRLLIGQEAITNLTEFELTGKDKKSLRNGLNSLQKKGFATAVYKPPHSPELVASLKELSDEWLLAYDRSEMAFAQGIFDEEELQEQTLIITKNAEGEPVAFLNIIPDYAPNECTYDLIRKTADAPGGCMDALIIELINWGKQQQKQYLNLGLAPMSGLENSTQTLERVMQYAYEKIRRFRHYQGLRSFKDKYASQWLNKYLVYENDFDLLRLPAALKKAMRPINKNR